MEVVEDGVDIVGVPALCPTFGEGIRIDIHGRHCSAGEFGWPSDFRAACTSRSQLAANVEKVVLQLVRGVYRDPAQRPFAGFRIVVDDRSVPVVGG